MTQRNSNTLNDPNVQIVLDRLHTTASGQTWKLARLYVPFWLKMKLTGRDRIPWSEMAPKFKDLYLPLDPEQGKFCYLLARSLNARRIVEYGTSFGVSTIYLAAAVRDNGGGIVIGTELVPEKVEKARQNIADAGLANFVEIRQGNALETLKEPGGTIDMVLLDGWKDLYVPIIQLLSPHIRAGGIAIGDNIFSFKKDLIPYVEYMQNPENGFQSVTLNMSDGTEFSVKQ